MVLLMRVQSRRTDAFPTTWDIPAGIALTWLGASVLAFPFGQGVAFVVAGDPFTWPGEQVGASLLGLVEGQPGRGLPAHPPELPPNVLVYACIAAAELTLSTLAAWALSYWWMTVGPLAQFGLASRAEVEAVLGQAALARRRATIRPDLQRRTRWRA
jgi:hypothetical protein